MKKADHQIDVEDSNLPPYFIIENDPTEDDM